MAVNENRLGQGRYVAARRTHRAPGHTARMATSANDPQGAALRVPLSGRRVLPYDERLTVACFDYGIHLAQTGADMPEWLTTAPHWARTAVAVGRSSAVRMIEEDRRSSACSAGQTTDPLPAQGRFWWQWMP